MRSYEEASKNYTGGGEITVRIVENPPAVETYAQRRKREAREAAGIVEEVIPFRGAQPKRTEAEEKRLAETLAEWETPEIKARAREWAENHPQDDNDF